MPLTSDSDSTNILKTLKKVFHHKDFRSETQKDAIYSITKGNHDVYVSMPTAQIDTKMAEKWPISN